MKRGRPPKRADHADSVEGSQLSKKRLKAILQTVSGERTVADVCEELGITETHFHRLRQKALDAAAAALEPQPGGRPARPRDPSAARVEELEEELAETKLDLRAAEIREELAVLMPHVLDRSDPEKKKRERNRRRRQKK
jgi:transposase-like protein